MHYQTVFALKLLLATCNVLWRAVPANFRYLPNAGYCALGASAQSEMGCLSSVVFSLKHLSCKGFRFCFCIVPAEAH